MIVSKFGMEEGAKNVSPPNLLEFRCSNLKNESKKELLCFSVFKNPQRELHLDRKAWFWILGIEAINFFRYKVGPYDLTTPMSRVKEPNKNRPFTRVITPSISGIWPTSYELLFFNFQGLSIRAFDSLGGEHLSLDSSNL